MANEKLVYMAVCSQENNVIKFYIWNRFTKKPHSHWDTFKEANEVAQSLNKIVKEITGAK